jgi:hypothetical protein
MLSRHLFPWLFALTLLFGQATAFAHALSHVDAHDAALHDPVCEVCIAQAHLGGAAPQKGFSLPYVPAAHVSVSAAAQPRVSVTVQSAQARAPPASA